MEHAGITKEEELELINRSIEHDRDAFARLYQCYFRKIYIFLRTRVRESSEVEDLTEQVFLNAWKGLPAYKNEGKHLLPWLYRLAHNITVDFYRQKDEADLSLDSDEVYSENMPTDPSDQVQRVLDMDELARAMRVLNEDQQQVITLRFIEGYSSREVSEILEKNENTIRSIQYRALETMRDYLEKAGYIQ